jgi:hypothetical protein
VTIGVHLLTGYLALLSIGVWILIAPSEFRTRLWRAVLVAGGALLVASWMLVPLLVDAKWTIEDEFSHGTYFYDSFGARRILGWLFTGGLFDARRLPVLTALVGAGVVVAIRSWRREETSRAILGVGALSLLLFFGRPTLGPALALLPGSSNLFLRRYVSGVHLAGIYLAGIGAWALLGYMKRSVLPRVAARVPRLRPSRPLVVGAAVIVIGAVVLAPAWTERYSFAAVGARWIRQQQVADVTSGAAFDALVAKAKSLGGGRIFAGNRAAGASGQQRIGQVPGYAALLNADADAVGFTRPTWSLTSGVEARFDPKNPAHFDLFGVSYSILPSRLRPVVEATLIAERPPFSLWRASTEGYLEVGDTVAPLSADRTNLGTRMAGFLASSLPAEHQFPTVAFGAMPAAAPTLAAGERPKGSPGEVVEELDGPADGTFHGVVEATRSAAVVLKSSFDPRWRAFVDGVQRPTEMVAPGFVAVDVPRGRHTVLFSYQAFDGYLPLLVLGVAALAGLVLVDRSAAVRRRPAST